MAGHIQRTEASRNFPKGGWEARYRVRDGAQSRWRGKTFATKREAERFLAETLTDIGRGEYIDPSRQSVTFESVAEQWLGAARLQLRPKTIAGYEWTLRTRLYPEWRSAKVGSIDLDAVQGWVNRSSASTSTPSLLGAYRVLRLVLGYAVDTGKLRSNPCNRKVRLPSMAEREMCFLTHEQVELLASTISFRPAVSKHAIPIVRPDLGVLIRFAAYTGLRAGEIAALRVRNLDLAKGTVSVEESTSDVAGKLVTGRPKTAKGRRIVHVDDDICSMLKAHVGDRRLDPNAYVFIGQQGAQWNHSNFRGRFWKEAVTRAVNVSTERGDEFPRSLRFHDLRHTFASFLVQEGVHVREMAELLGHASAQITPGAKATTAHKLGAARRAVLAASAFGQVG
jgi:integrase